jgi:predicted nucleotidyltransferase
MMAELKPPISQRLSASAAQISAFCQRWKVTELALFGSVLRDDFRPDSDIDVLLTFDPDARWSLFGWVDMKDELETLFERKVDIADKEGLKNPYRRHEILRTQQVIYGYQARTD